MSPTPRGVFVILGETLADAEQYRDDLADMIAGQKVVLVSPNSFRRLDGLRVAAYKATTRAARHPYYERCIATLDRSVLKSRPSTESDATALEFCPDCTTYLEQRAHVLTPHIVRLAHERGLSPVKLAARVRGSIHARHLAGLSLAVTP